jgi:hypothetical protein
VKFRFLIDANLSPALSAAAWERGHQAYHVRDLGRQDDGDPVLLKLIQDEGYTLVTNNVVEFRNRYRNRQVLHAGVVFIAEATRGRQHQIGAFQVALDHIAVHGTIDDTELLVEPDQSQGYKVTPAPLP